MSVVNIQQDVTTGGDLVSTITQQGAEFQAWYATEVPSIVTGLKESNAISARTADVAWRLINQGAYDRALSLVMGEVF